jgi:hypothetical protein
LYQRLLVMKTETELIFLRQHTSDHKKTASHAPFQFILYFILYFLFCFLFPSYAFSQAEAIDPALSITGTNVVRGTIHIKKESPAIQEPAPDPIDRFWTYGIRYGYNCGGFRGRKPFLTTRKHYYYWSRHVPFVESYQRYYSCSLRVVFL